MAINISKTIGTAALTILMLAVFARIPVSAQDIVNKEKSDEQTQEVLSAQRRNARALEGVWDILITFRNCETGEPIRTRPGLMSFFRGGIMQEFGTGSAPLDRSDAQGVWRHQSRQHFASTAKAFRFAADGSNAGSVKLYRQIELSADGNYFEISVNSEVFDTNGVLTARGCATETGTRFE